MWLVLAFILVPLIEIALFIEVGGAIGLWPTLAIVVITALAGAALVRSQGLETLARLRQALDRLEDPTEPLAHGAMILFSGALLLTPGFFTDTVGFLLLVPAVRRAIIRWVAARMATAERDIRTTVIDVEYEEIDPDAPRRHPPSGWTGH